MKTAEKMIQDFTITHPHVRAKDVVAMLMRDYAKQVAEQALKDAAENVHIITHTGKYISVESILSTPIITP